MQDSKRVKVTGSGIVLRGNDIDTDRVIPARYLRTVVFDGLGEHAFEDERAALKAKGQTHAFDEAKYANAEVLLVNKNFGCGSSIFFGNCVSLGIPCAIVDATGIEQLMAAVEKDPTAAVTVDLQTKQVSVGSVTVPFTIGDGVRQQFLEGRWDTTAELLANRDTIAKTATQLPYLNQFR
jgi:3-isopropylmalate/(R)-2-methylmalate dehydratase small subunit